MVLNESIMIAFLLTSCGRWLFICFIFPVSPASQKKENTSDCCDSDTRIKSALTFERFWGRWRKSARGENQKRKDEFGERNFWLKENEKKKKNKLRKDNF